MSKTAYRAEACNGDIPSIHVCQVIPHGVKCRHFSRPGSSPAVLQKKRPSLTKRQVNITQVFLKKHSHSRCCLVLLRELQNQISFLLRREPDENLPIACSRQKQQFALRCDGRASKKQNSESSSVSKT